MANPSSLPFARPPASFIGATIEVADLVASTAFHRRWLPLLGFTRIGADADRVLWARRDQHLMLREAAVDAATGGAILALAARDRAQVDALHAHLQGIGAEITQAPAEEPIPRPATTASPSAAPMARASKSPIAGRICPRSKASSMCVCRATA